jgi:4-amino-4-deoxy-L-arabinose transferase-like glycosyltransferase
LASLKSFRHRLQDLAARLGTVQRDVLLLLLAGTVLFAAGIGLRDPWPADEPRFALIALDMVARGQWLIPSVGGDLYPDKPPLFFWAIAVFYQLTGSLRAAFLLPSLLAALGSLLLVYDLGRRAWSRESGLAAALLLACSVQFVLQARTAQIDMLLTFFTTAALYGIGRHLLVGPDWRAYALGGFAAGLGVITKGTGFLPLLLLLPFFALRRLGFGGLWTGQGGAKWWLAPGAALLAIALWLLPMLLVVALSRDPQLAAYRDEILLQQTVTRYAAAWHHHQPWHYFILQVIPGLWLPGIALLPWLLPRWRRAWAERQGGPWLFLGWILLVLVFFSISPGKRGVYVLPALPALALAAAPWLPALWERRQAQQLVFGLAALLVVGCVGAMLYLVMLQPARMAELAEHYGVSSLAPLAAMAAGIAVVLVVLGPRRGFVAWWGSLAVVAVVLGFWINPMIDGARSGRDFVAHLERVTPTSVELGLLAYREQYLLQLTRPLTNFGHRRDREGDQETYDAAAWLNLTNGRVLLVDEFRRDLCFAESPATRIGAANRSNWYLVLRPADPDCAERGNLEAARDYEPPQR